ncbi:hypothetical protein GT360_15845 [Vibrio astriarenae]|uniref:Uncharacterized protein n=1 Tax=Vibrio astriarenae TaxID=1481923 RepID=A0A7Z2T5Y8_9VIBR|nr:hypothetical protein [Vibrio astriarenae]QIA65034.1 hypothetical protein GT360_15845 [Vibrio astriarenae]
MKQSTLLVLTCLISAFSHAHEYEYLTATPRGQWYVNAIESDRLFPVSQQSINQLYDYYVDMKLKSPWESKDRILKDPNFYSSIRSFSGETCGLLWRYTHNKPAKYRVNGIEEKPQLNVTRKETTPFFDQNCPWYEERYGITFKGKQNAYYHFLAAGKNFNSQDFGFAIHKSGASFGYGRGKRKHLVFSMQTYFLGVVDGQIASDTLIERDIALISPIYIPMTIQDISRINSEADAYRQCSDQAKFILPQPKQ